MALQASYFKKVFRFNFEARTSRGLMENKTSWFIKLWDDANPERYGIGECGPLPGLSIDATPDFENVLTEVIRKISCSEGIGTLQQIKEYSAKNFGAANGGLPIALPFAKEIPPHFPTLTFGIETACLDLIHGGKRIIFKNDFLKGKPIPINGLIWMGALDFMMQQIQQKIAQGFQCIKLKVGSLNFDEECNVLRNIRKHHPSHEITIRLDANGAFHPDEALFKLERLSKYDIHSIEQPIKEGRIETETLCRESPIPIALDEELIRYETSESKQAILDRLKPAYIILKPTLHGGLRGCQEWIEVAEELGIGWWITSALESNIGLNAICQFAANHDVQMPQGLGTGSIYRNNIDSPLHVENGHIFLDNSRTWDVGSAFQ